MTKHIQEKANAVRRQHIIEAAIKVFAAHGYHRATIRDIAREAGVADGTIYNIFENKTALLFSMLESLDETTTPSNPPKLEKNELRQILSHLLERRWETFTPETLNVLRIVLSEAMINEDIRRLYMVRVITPLLTVSEPPFKALTDAGKAKTDDLSMLLRSITAMVIGLTTLRLLGDEQTDARWNEFPQYLASLFAEGLVPRADDGGPDGKKRPSPD